MLNYKLEFRISNNLGFRIFKIVGLVLVFSLVYLNITYAQTVSSTELINNAVKYDGKTVRYSGEVIGEVMARGEYAWVNLYDGANAIGVWTPKELTKEIIYTGDYKTKGDVIEVEGIFHRACIEHGGDLDIHAVSLRKLAPGRKLEQRLNTGKRNFSIFLLAVLAALWTLRQLKRS